MTQCECGRYLNQSSDRLCPRCAALRTLGLEHDASRSEIREAYRDLVKVWHPDRFPNDVKLRSRAEEKLKDVNAAFQHLNSTDDTPPARAASATRNPDETPKASKRPSQSSSTSARETPRPHTSAQEPPQQDSTASGFPNAARPQSNSNARPQSPTPEANRPINKGVPRASFSFPRIPNYVFIIIFLALRQGWVEWHKMPHTAAPEAETAYTIVPLSQSPSPTSSRPTTSRPQQPLAPSRLHTLAELHPEINFEAPAEGHLTPKQKEDRVNSPGADPRTFAHADEAYAAVAAKGKSLITDPRYLALNPQGRQEKLAAYYDYVLVPTFQKFGGKPPSRELYLARAEKDLATNKLSQKPAIIAPLKHSSSADAPTMTHVENGDAIPLQVSNQNQSWPHVGGGYFTKGSSIDEVLSIEGTPSSIIGDTYFFGMSSVTFRSGRVVGWDSSTYNLLKVALPPKSLSSSPGFITVGSSIDEVLSIEGTPSSIIGDTYFFGMSSVTFRSGRVVGWDSSSFNPLKLKNE